MNFSDPLSEKVIALLKKEFAGKNDVFLVGGAIRDSILDKRIHDLDFVMPDHTIRAAKIVADHFQGDFYILDHSRKTARAIIFKKNLYITVDFALLNGKSIQADLQKRDFTINAMAWNLLDPAYVIDPLSGQQHLAEGRLVPCSIGSFSDDPVRVLRAVRFATVYNLTMTGAVKNQIKVNADKLHIISSERIRDELFSILTLNKVNALNAMVELGIFPQVFQEFISDEKYNLVFTSYPIFPIASKLINMIQGVLFMHKSPEQSEIFELLENTDNFNKDLKNYLKTQLVAKRNLMALLVICPIILDLKKQGHSEISSMNPNNLMPQLIEKWSRRMALSVRETNYLKRLFYGVALLEKMHFNSKDLVIGDVYQFFKATDEAGVGAVLTCLAENYSVKEENISGQNKEMGKKNALFLMDAWFKNREKFFPDLFVNGDEIMSRYSLPPGKLIGEILEEIRIAQITGTVTNKNQAICLIARLIEQHE